VPLPSRGNRTGRPVPHLRSVVAIHEAAPGWQLVTPRDFCARYPLEVASRIQRIYKHSEGSDHFLRAGFRVGSAPVRARLNQIAREVLLGMDSVKRVGVPQSMEACSQLDAQRAAVQMFGIAAGTALRGGPITPRRSYPWNFVLELGRGFGAGYSMTKRPETNASLMGKGLYFAYWHWDRYVEIQCCAPAHRAVDRGLGCMIWLGCGADAVMSASIAHSFSMERQPEIWKGLGFALSFLSSLVELRSQSCEALVEPAGPLTRFLVEGAAFGAFQRERLHDVDQQVEQICREVSGESAAALINSARHRSAAWE
jgi:hypothetical protein